MTPIFPWGVSGLLWEVFLSTMTKISGHCRARKKLKFHLALGTSTCSSQILLALGKPCFALLMIHLADDLSNPLPIVEVRFTSYSPKR